LVTVKDFSFLPEVEFSFATTAMLKFSLVSTMASLEINCASPLKTSVGVRSFGSSSSSLLQDVNTVKLPNNTANNKKPKFFHIQCGF
jgi:hypothetical protein